MSVKIIREILFLLATFSFKVCLSGGSKYDVYFQYYSDQYTVIKVPESNIGQIKISANSQIYIFIHGYWDYWNSPHYYGMKNQLWSNGNTNIAMIDYGKYAAALEYRTAVEAAKGIANIVCSWILALSKSQGVSLEAFNLVGVHLGAHIAGFVGKCVYAGAQVKIGFIFALDPCGAPYYTSNTPASDRLDNRDARVLIAFRTDIFFYGYSDILGHIDVYINQGYNHNFCTPGLCGHLIVLDVFVYCLAHHESFTAIQCDSYDNYSKCQKDSSTKTILVCGGRLGIRDAGIYYVRYVPRQ